jgi:hypothetical protein
MNAVHVRGVHVLRSAKVWEHDFHPPGGYKRAKNPGDVFK